MQQDFNLTEPQERFIFSDDQFPAFIGGFGSGKTEALIGRTLLNKFAYPHLNQGYFAPTYDLLRLIAYPRIMARLEDWGIPYRLNRSEGIFHISGLGQIICRNLETPERIVGFEVADANIDELDTLKIVHARDAWNKIIARCRQRKPDGKVNTAAVGTTPEGFRFCHERWGGAKLAAGYALFKAPTRSNPYLPEDYIRSLEATYPPNLVRAYVEGEFVNMTTGSVYPDFDRRLNNTDAEYRPGEPLHIGMDFNVNNMTAVVCVIRGGQPLAVYELTGVRDTPAMAAALLDHFPNHPISVYPDASGNARKSANASVTDHAILRQAGFSLIVNPANPAVRDRVNSLNAMLLNDRGERRLLINVDRCPRTAECIEKQSFDNNGDPDKTSGFDHPPDALGYFIQHRFPIVKPLAIIRMGRSQ